MQVRRSWIPLRLGSALTNFRRIGPRRKFRGKRVDVFNPKESSQDDILAAVMGRSGNLRAPTLQGGGTRSLLDLTSRCIRHNPGNLRVESEQL